MKNLPAIPTIEQRIAWHHNIEGPCLLLTESFTPPKASNDRRFRPGGDTLSQIIKDMARDFRRARPAWIPGQLTSPERVRRELLAIIDRRGGGDINEAERHDTSQWRLRVEQTPAETLWNDYRSQWGEIVDQWRDDGANVYEYLDAAAALNLNTDEANTILELRAQANLHVKQACRVIEPAQYNIEERRTELGNMKRSLEDIATRTREIINRHNTVNQSGVKK